MIKNIQDCCHYSNEIIYLLQDYSIICHHQSYRYITNNRKLKSIVSYNGYLYGIDKKGILYVLSNDYYEMTYWIWKKVKGAPHHIEFINSTTNCNFLLLQTKDENYLYNACYEYQKIKIAGKRIYGKNDQCYMDIDKNNCHVYVDGCLIKSFKYILNGVMNHDNDIFLINIHDTEHKYVRLINYKPFYF